ncbi:MAG TPA: ABC transporter permease [Vicinamibacterales bacterium]|nr:ABC transporter permease [Vicinamibacterales bacterium]
MELFLQDLKHAFRMFKQNRVFTAAAIAALALGIGANTAIFSVVSAVLLKPLPFSEPDRLVFFMNTSAQNGFGNPASSPAKFAHWRQETTVIQDASAFRTNVLNYTGGAFPEQLRAGQVSADYFKLFGAPVFRGRTFSREEDLPNGPHVAVLTHGLWTRRFGSDPAIIGKTLLLSGDPHEVIGIIGPQFDIAEFGGDSPELWIPFQLDPNTIDQGHFFQSAARLKSGIPLEQAQARLKLSGKEFQTKYPAAFRDGDGFTVQPVQQVFVRNARPTLLILSAAVAFVLLIACANVANLLLVRATARKREVALRSAIGAGRGRIVRQLLTESVALSVLGGAIGLVFGVLGIRVLLSINTAGLPRIGEDGVLVGLDWRVLLFTAVVSVGTGVLFGLIPALQSSRTDLTTALKDSTGRSGATLRHNKARSTLVVVEVALALLLLVGSALLIRTLVALRSVEPGFDASNVLTMRMSLTGPKYFQTAGVEHLVRDGLERLRGLPGVEAAAATCCVPLEGGYGLPFRIIGRPLEKGPFHGGGAWLTVSAGYFDAFKIPIKRGRGFNDRDDAVAPPVVLINEAMAKQYWKDKDPIGERLMIGGGVMKELATERERQIIGVVSDVRDGGLNNDPGPHMYVPNAQVPDALNALNVRITPVAWVVRTRGEPYAMSTAIQEQLRQSSGLPVSDVRSMEEVVSRSISRQRFNVMLMTVFGSSALLLAGIGIYGLMAYSVEQRTQEIGIRIALGAEADQVRRMVVLQGMRLAVIGVVVGLGAAFGLTRLMASALYGVQPRDPAVFIVIPVVLTLVSLVAVWLPARRASMVNPLTALRTQ